MSILETLNKIHENKYDYIISDYENMHSKIKVICKEHGIFEIRCYHHFKGRGCRKCKKINDGKIFIEKSKIIHNDKYDYSLVEYENQRCKVKIICKKHGEFTQVPYLHLSGSGCPKCFNESRYNNQELETNKFIDLSIKKHGNRFDYSKCIYINSKTKVNIICKKHGEFKQIPSSHLNFKEPCPKCRKLSKSEIIKIFNKKHNNLYDYSKFIYDDNTTNTKSYINIICKKHGEFIQRINHHMRGTGCPTCRESQGEKMISEVLLSMGLKINKDFFRQQTFEDLINENNLYFDFYIPKYKLCIEYDGDQHYTPVKLFGGEKAFSKIIKRDKIKNEYCFNNNIHLFRFNRNHKIEDIELKIKSLMNFQYDQSPPP